VTEWLAGVAESHYRFAIHGLDRNRSRIERLE
jgi:hypothetical protein